ncbi:hypothetical protein GCM10008967_28740 [Bacillus carboniphilus]|uniref:DUF4878 domain-containing protein n=1 Tax=Bacillus carboniphilus TaxID=86663 RepID=A0ABP3G8C7_9BACI
MRKRIFQLIFFILLLCGCSKTLNNSTPEDTINSFLNAMKSENYEEASLYLNMDSLAEEDFQSRSNWVKDIKQEFKASSFSLINYKVKEIKNQSENKKEIIVECEIYKKGKNKNTYDSEVTFVLIKNADGNWEVIMDYW